MNSFEAKQLSPTALAFVGDAVFDVFVRTHVLVHNPARELHTPATRYTSAKGQAVLAAKLERLLNEDEREIFRRAKNARLAHIPKSATEAEYHLATALEAVCGFLHLCGEGERLEELLEAVINNAS
ncbi:MAG: ribonuclease III [Clostridia bacterium]|nr:ribonuclease III [Clostridia bacterium]